MLKTRQSPVGASTSEEIIISSDILETSIEVSDDMSNLEVLTRAFIAEHGTTAKYGPTIVSNWGQTSMQVLFKKRPYTVILKENDDWDEYISCKKLREAVTLSTTSWKN